MFIKFQIDFICPFYSTTVGLVEDGPLNGQPDLLICLNLTFMWILEE